MCNEVHELHGSGGERNSIHFNKKDWYFICLLFARA